MFVIATYTGKSLWAPFPVLASMDNAAHCVGVHPFGILNEDTRVRLEGLVSEQRLNGTPGPPLLAMSKSRTRTL